MVRNEKDGAMAEESKREMSTRWRRLYDERRFGILLVILLLLIAGSPMMLGFGFSANWFDTLMLLMMFATILSLCVVRRERTLLLIVGAPAMLSSLGELALPEDYSVWVGFFGQFCGMVFLFSAAGLIIKSMFTHRTLTFDSVFGAVCGYLFLGVGWAMSYKMIETVQPGSFEISQSLVSPDETVGPAPHVLTYYSFVTLTTVGYGDVSPVSAVTRTLAWVEAITGQFYLAVIVAGLVSMLATKTNSNSSPPRT